MTDRTVTPIRRQPNVDPPPRLPRYTMLADGREVDMPCGSYVGALVHARTEALIAPGVRYEVRRDGELIAKYTARGGRIAEAWIR